MTDYDKTLATLTFVKVAQKGELCMTDHDKTLATLQARAALAGATMTSTEDDHGQTVYIVSRWALTKHFDSLEAVQLWLDSYGVQQ